MGFAGNLWAESSGTSSGRRLDAETVQALKLAEVQDCVFGRVENAGKLIILRRSWQLGAEDTTYLDINDEAYGSVEVLRSSGTVNHKLQDGREQRWRIIEMQGADPFTSLGDGA